MSPDQALFHGFSGLYCFVSQQFDCSCRVSYNNQVLVFQFLDQLSQGLFHFIADNKSIGGLYPHGG